MAASFLLAVFVMTQTGSQEVRRAMMEQYTDAAYNTARTAQTYLNPEHIADYVSPDGGANPDECRYIQGEWQRLAGRNSQGVLMIYLIQTSSQDNFNYIKFGLTAAHPSLFEDHPDVKISPVGAVRRSGEAQRKAYAEIYNGANRAVVNQPQQWHEDHITVIIPVRTKSGSIAGLICVQRRMERLRSDSENHTRKLLTSALLLLIIITPVWAWGLHKWLLKPIKTITQETLRFADKNTLPELQLSALIKTSNEIGSLAASIDAMEAQNVDYVANLMQATRRQEQIQSELNVARDIQLSMLPNNFNLRPELDIAASMTAAKEVGGDFYDFYIIDADRVAVTIADVSGKGVPAALFMVTAKTVLKNCILSANSLADAVTLANKQLCQGNDNFMFVTVFAGVLNLKTSTFNYVNAGHNPPLYFNSAKFEYLPMAQNGLLGISDNIKFTENTLTLAHADGIFMYTDGITEAENANHEFFNNNNDRLLTALNACANANNNANAANYINYVTQQTANFVQSQPQADDMTMLFMRYL